MDFIFPGKALDLWFLETSQGGLHPSWSQMLVIKNDLLIILISHYKIDLERRCIFSHGVYEKGL
jgi:hypothetical protein